MDFHLRPWKESDLASLVHHANNPKIAANMTDGFPHPYTEEAGKRFIQFAGSGNPPNIMAIEIEGRAVGGIGIHPQQDIYRRNAELGYWLSEDYWGMGIVTEAIRKMVTYAFDRFEIDRIFARPFSHNLASRKVLEKAGFTLEAILKGTIVKGGQTFDECIYALRRTK